MRNLLVTTFLSLDGVMQAPGGPEEDPSDGFTLGGWSFHYFDDEVGEEMDQVMGRPFDLLLGRKTYDLFAGFWPNAPEDQTSAALNRATKYVASRGTPELSWANSVQLEGDVAAAVEALKQSDGPELQVHGSGDLIQTLLAAGLVDRWHLVIHPVLIGSGRRLFADGTIPVSLRLVEGRVTKGGTFLGTYEPAGDVVVGSFG
jgi:dihydrofolate reductase